MIREVNDINQLDNIVREYKVTKNPYNKLMVYELDNKVVGFIDYSIIYDKVELNYIIVLPNYRNQGIASKLMDFLLNDAEKNESINITLEANINNECAINLYKKYGFNEVTIRKNYYNGEDAIMMMRMM
ncbi:MAG: ribosomal protein S18-alanine N-acetyltransferase [Ignavibacteriales bacterium]